MVELQEKEVTEQVDTPPLPQTAGGILRQARESSGMNVARLAEMLKVPVAKVVALEEEDWKTLPDAVFTRSLALGVCKALHIDAAPVLALLPKAQTAQKFTAPGPGINAPFRDKALRSVHDSPASGGAWKLGALAIAAAVAVGAVYFIQQDGVREAVVSSVQERSDRAMGQGSAVSDAAPSVAGHDVVPPSVNSAVDAASPVTANAEASNAAEGASAPTPAVVPFVAVPATPVAPATETAVTSTPAVTAPSQAVDTAPVASATPAEPAPVMAANSTLRIDATASTWIQVRGGGKVLEQKRSMQVNFLKPRHPSHCQWSSAASMQPRCRWGGRHSIWARLPERMWPDLR